MAGVFHVEHSGNFYKISEKPKIGRMPEKPKARPTGRAPQPEMRIILIFGAAAPVVVRRRCL